MLISFEFILNIQVNTIPLIHQLNKSGEQRDLKNKNNENQNTTIMSDKAKAISVYDIRITWAKHKYFDSFQSFRDLMICIEGMVDYHNKKHNDNLTSSIVFTPEFEVAKRYPLC